MTYTPWMGRKFGVEMEMESQRTTAPMLRLTDVSNALVNALAGVAGAHPVRGSFHSNGSAWDVKTDASCGYEVASPALVMDADAECAELKAACDGIAALNPRVSRACGLHVHVEVRDFTWRDLRALITLWSKYEPFFFSLQPASRRDNRYCEALRKSEWAAQDRMQFATVKRGLEGRELGLQQIQQTYGKYSSLNLNYFWTRGTVEFRLGAGTVQYEKIQRWVQLLLALVQRAKGTAAGYNTTWALRAPKGDKPWPSRKMTVDGMMGILSLDVADAPTAALARWAQARQAHFARSQSVEA